MRRLACVIALAACGDERSAATSPPPEPEVADRPTQLEVAIATQLALRVGGAVKVTCGALPPRCTATLPDRASVPIRIARSPDGWTWGIERLIVAADPIESYLRDMLADLGAVQSVSCAPRIRVLDAGDRIACSLERGGKAFVTVSADGSFAVEIELDPRAGAARSEELGARTFDRAAPGSGSAGDLDE